MNLGIQQTRADQWPDWFRQLAQQQAVAAQNFNWPGIFPRPVSPAPVVTVADVRAASATPVREPTESERKAIEAMDRACRRTTDLSSRRIGSWHQPWGV